MELTGESVLAAPRDVVWRALNDPEVLARCIEGMDMLTATSDAAGAPHFAGTIKTSGPVSATLAAGVTLTEVDAPNGYVLISEGHGSGGLIKGMARVRLTDAGIGTRLKYAVSSCADGRYAQLVEETARGWVESVFARLKAEVEATVADPSLTVPLGVVTAEPVATIAATEPMPAGGAAIVDDAQALHGSRRRTGLTALVWCSVVILVVLAVLAWEMR